VIDVLIITVPLTFPDGPALAPARHANTPRITDEPLLLTSRNLQASRAAIAKASVPADPTALGYGAGYAASRAAALR
jgi:hypothetical protein